MSRECAMCESAPVAVGARRPLCESCETIVRAEERASYLADLRADLHGDRAADIAETMADIEAGA